MSLITTDKQRIIVGLGSSGLSVARYLAGQGLSFAVADTRENPPGLEKLKRFAPMADLYLGELDEALLCAADELIVSPGVALATPALQAAAKAGIYGTKERSVINVANAEGIEQVVAQQFEVARQVIAAGLVPIIEPEVNIHSDTKSEAEDMLKAALLKHLDTLADGDDVMLKLTIPNTAGLYDDLADHARVVRVVALSGGYSTDVACEKLSQNTKMIASFSRALTEGLQRSMSDAEFNTALGTNIDKIYRASI